MNVTILVCTRNRAESLGKTLDQFVAMKKPDDFTFEIVVVNNGSTDNTSEVVQSFSKILPIREVKQPIAGLSNARNAGVASAAGEYIIWTDDDVLVDPDWLCAYANAFRSGDHAFFGGKVNPVLVEPSPAWFLECRPDLDDLIGGRDFGNDPRALSVERLPFGSNYAVKTSVQRGYHYDPLLGVGPGRYRSGEETAVMRAMLSDGHTGLYVPSSAVNHIIPQSRQTMRYVHNYYRAQGETSLLEKAAHRGKRPFRWAAKQALVSLGKIVISWAAYQMLLLAGQRRKALRFIKTFARSVGTISALKDCWTIRDVPARFGTY